MAEREFDGRMQLKVLRSMIPDFKRYLVPSKIISDLAYFLDVGQQRVIVETEKHSRQEAVQMLIEAVIAKKEDGVSYFIHALEEGQNGCYERFLNPLTGTGTSTPAEENNPAMVNKYFSDIIRLLEGQIIRNLTDVEVEDLMQRLHQEDIIDEADIDDLHAMTHQKKAVHLFRLLPQASPEWPLKFFRALNMAKPELMPKCDPLNESPYDERGKEAAALERAPGSEETLPKRQRGRSREDSEGEHSEEESADFSDGEEEKEDGDTEKAAQAQSFSMRKYQYELATPALMGENTIICAPTGSGKTRVALYIVKKHLDSRDMKARKVVFMARTVPLVSQQFKIFEKYLPNFKCGIVHGETADREVLHLMLDDFDILVMTPKILENHLAQKKILSLSVFSLIIFDECHHTRKDEPYNAVMKHYLQFKKDGERDLPQIVGLTASIGVEKASNLESATSSIINIMANLNVSSITKVKDNLDELNMTVPRPDECLVELTSRADDEVNRAIRCNMVRVEHLLDDQVPVPNLDPEYGGVSALLGKRPAERNSQKYGQWAVKVCDQARKVHIPDQPDRHLSAEMIERRRLFSQRVQLLAETLIAYNEALDVHELTRPVDVLHHLKRKLDPRHTADSPPPTKMEMVLLNLFEGLQKTLRRAATALNPNLGRLLGVIEERMEGQWDSSRVMVFVRTRATCQALCSWMNEDDSVGPQLRNFKASPFTGTAAHQEHGGMTQHVQEGVIEKFRDGDVKLLVCTTVGQEGMDIPDCNLVIRYNQVGNEVATVQTRGRSRKAGGVSVLLAMPEVIRKERVNKKRVEIMNEAIDSVNQMRAREVTNKVLKAQKQAMDKEEIKKIASMRSKKSKVKKGSFSLACARCKKVQVPGSSIRTIDNSHHVVIGMDLVESQQVSVKVMDRPKVVDDNQFTADIICNQCPVTKQNYLGIIMKSQGADFLTLKAQSWLVRDEEQRVVKTGKWKWKDIPYSIPELTAQDMRAHLGEQVESEGEEGAVGGAASN
ncbi:ATP-dependent RNA helicase DHX58-like [Babylonia areolata]|uniref:ATP-dependent RNA helicase DHX58-like n=1 Tax=Babylonia areolata TaxID=304850 RepID=UPI003FD552C9